MAAQTQKCLLGKFFGARGITRSPDQEPKDRHPKLLKMRDHLLAEGHRQRALPLSLDNGRSQGVIGEISVSKHHLFYYMTVCRWFLRGAANLISYFIKASNRPVDAYRRGDIRRSRGKAARFRNRPRRLCQVPGTGAHCQRWRGLMCDIIVA